LSHYFNHIPNSAELQYEEFDSVRFIVTNMQDCQNNDDRPLTTLLTMLSDVYPSPVWRHGSTRRSCLPDASK
jgi:hypothetical protein